ncbi:MAG: hypothetical protein A2677_01935 [Candidatus Komeilibacteria bacterium RIFCSPHIGHO2_01_FULL_52_14]|uniref:Peptidase M50 domain-containing protein n=1 Tax=Candidatus Komeilibacteria bacterium RIFCSPHIGHO2_01_FULL_52_14 TaxID=1798549 RepID=A0A1G2BMQ1_9BACT|nr:MAG: hypothetical protein A2677_01935 [Candidatus Komeilibacteria bacterium RIFCSPHIGHO2_01_FULL_52_14]
MLFDLLSSGPIVALAFVAALALGISIHEFSHALAAYLQGDMTARDAGRLTLNPLAHLDPVGSIMLLLAGFGWGKPTPYNPYNLRFRRFGPLLVALAGPVSNAIGGALSLTSAALLLPVLGEDNVLIIFLSTLFFVNVMLMLFNLLPLPPLDGSQILFTLLPDRFHAFKVALARNGPWLLLGFIILDNVAGLHLFGSVYNFFLNLLDRFIGL